MIYRDDIAGLMQDYRLKGYCCSQIVTDIGLKAMDKENPDMVEASAGLCFGLNCGKLCGALSAAVQILFLHDPEEATMSSAQHLTDWFEETCGSTECEDILEGDPINKIEKCPNIVEAVINEMLDLMEFYD